MRTYDLNSKSGSLYKNLCDCIREDIKNGVLSGDEKLPSKRSLADNLGVSTITVEKAYDQLISEGYIYSIPQKGYYVSAMIQKHVSMPRHNIPKVSLMPQKVSYDFDFSSNMIEAGNFPFSVWARISRQTISMREKDLMTISSCNGVYELRKAIADHLADFRGMMVDPDRIVIGAGTEYLYQLIIKLLGSGKVYAIENPGHVKICKIYELNNTVCRLIQLDEMGITMNELRKSGADVVHITPTHHFPTGITMPVSRRYELLAWANETDGRYIIEDDYDSEFRNSGSPIPTLHSIDTSGRVIYINTFSKSLSSTIRISYMVLPEDLARLYYEKLSFLSCTVPTFEQYTLAAFIKEGYLEKHIGRMRLYYKRKRKKVLDIFKDNLDAQKYKVTENDSGLHFLLTLNTKVSDKKIVEHLKDNHIHISSVNDYDMLGVNKKPHTFLINYSNLDIDKLPGAISILKDVI